MSDLLTSVLGALGPKARRAVRQGRAAAKALSEQATHARQIAQAGLALAEGADQVAKSLGVIADKIDAAVGSPGKKEDPRVRVRPSSATQARPRASSREVVDAEIVNEPRKR